MSPQNIIAVIPAYNPDSRLTEIVNDLAGAMNVVVVNDGSGDGSVFESLSRKDGVTVLNHRRNRGKGAALKTAFEEVLKSHGNADAVVTLDADGQHLVDDVKKVVATARADAKAVTLGVRSFDRNVPLLSRIGNLLTVFVIRLIVRRKISDTQTGLRVIPLSLLKTLHGIRYDGYEFETEMLMVTERERYEIRETPIRTVYIDENRGSHFHPVVDSMKIYWVLLRHVFTGLLSAVIDTVVFLAVYFLGAPLLVSVYTGRVASMFVNFTLLRRFAFRADDGSASVKAKYLAQVLVIGLLVFCILSLLDKRAGISPAYSKVPVEFVMYFVNFAIQKRFVFKRSGPYY